MKLHIKRSIESVNPPVPLPRDSWAYSLPAQQRVYYVTSFYIEFSPEELEIIKKYHLEEYPLAYFPDGKPSWRVKDHLGFTKDKPCNYKNVDVMQILDAESSLSDRCKGIKALLNAVSSFAEGKEGTLEF